MPATLNALATWLVPLIVGLAGGWVGAYVGMKVGLARLETRMEEKGSSTDKDIASIQQWQRDRERERTDWLRDEYNRAVGDINGTLGRHSTEIAMAKRDAEDARAWQTSEGEAALRGVADLDSRVKSNDSRLTRLEARVLNGRPT